jgi:hypothetical protein
VYTKRALAEGEFSYLIVHVSNKTAKDNVVRFARHAGFPVEKTDEREGEFFITIANTEELPPTLEPKHKEPESGSAAETGPADQSGESQEDYQEREIFIDTAASGPSPGETPRKQGSAGRQMVRTILLGHGTAIQRGQAGMQEEHPGASIPGDETAGGPAHRVQVSPFLDRFLRSLSSVHSDVQQIILTGGASLLAEEGSDYLPILLMLRRRGIAIYCDEESCDEWKSSPSPEAVTLIDARSLTEKLLRYAPVLTF